MSEKKHCERCGKPAMFGFRFCLYCLEVVRHEMYRAGYFRRRPRQYTDPEPRR